MVPYEPENEDEVHHGNGHHEGLVSNQVSLLMGLHKEGGDVRCF